MIAALTFAQAVILVSSLPVSYDQKPPKLIAPRLKVPNYSTTTHASCHALLFHRMGKYSGNPPNVLQASSTRGHRQWNIVAFPRACWTAFVQSVLRVSLRSIQSGQTAPQIFLLAGKRCHQNESSLPSLARTKLSKISCRQGSFTKDSNRALRYHATPLEQLLLRLQNITEMWIQV